MKRLYILSGLIVVAVAAYLAITAPRIERVEGDYFYAITNAGTLCGYSVIDTSLALIDGRQVVLLEQTAFSMTKLLGMDVDSNVKLVYHIDPETGRFLYHNLDVDNGQSRFSAEIRVQQDGAHCSSTFGPGDRVVELPPGTLLENSLFFKHVLRDFAATDVEELTYRSFDVNDQAVQEVRYSRAGTETIELAGREFDTVKVDKRNLVTGTLVRMWLDTETGACVKVLENEGRVIYLADSSLAGELERFDVDPYILTRTNMSIADVTGVDYMKVRARIKPTGMIVTPESLNVPGQAFTGTVEDNVIEGVFEIEHPRYDGTDAPPFPPDFGGEPDLARYVRPSDFIESDDPGIADRARILTEGAADSWEAARRLSEWVSTEITYAIPGGGTARGVYESRAGECGGHSVLLAAFCRSVGIPARMVWGVTYVPSQGGVFGQHGWTEIYMGPAGWVPVDATGPEVDFIDSGHIRLGEFESFATWANSKEYEILDYRVAGASPAATEAAEARYEAYLGEYSLDGLPEPCAMFVQDGSLVFDIPGNTALALDDPDESGRWYCKMTRHVYFLFERDEFDRVVEAHLHEVHELQKKSTPDDLEDVPEAVRPFIGGYMLAAANSEFTVSFERGSLWMHDPLANTTSTLGFPDPDGGWISDNGRHKVYFERDDDGVVNSLKIDATSRFRR